MNNVPHDILLDKAIDIRAARTLCRDGWSCEQINAVLKNIAISAREFKSMQTQSRELDKLQNEFGSPIEALRIGHSDPSQSEIDFLNRGPAAAAAVLQDKGWENDAIHLVIKESMFVPMDESAAGTWSSPQASQMTPNRAYGAIVPAHALSIYGGSPQTYSTPGSYGTTPSSKRYGKRRRGRPWTFGQDVFALTCLAGAALALIYALL